MIEHKIPRYIIITFNIYYLVSIIMSGIHFYLNPNLNFIIYCSSVKLNESILFIT